SANGAAKPCGRLEPVLDSAIPGSNSARPGDVAWAAGNGDGARTAPAAGAAASVAKGGPDGQSGLGGPDTRGRTAACQGAVQPGPARNRGAVAMPAWRSAIAEPKRA